MSSIIYASHTVVCANISCINLYYIENGVKTAEGKTLKFIIFFLLPPLSFPLPMIGQTFFFSLTHFLCFPFKYCVLQYWQNRLLTSIFLFAAKLCINYLRLIAK